MINIKKYLWVLIILLLGIITTVIISLKNNKSITTTTETKPTQINFTSDDYLVLYNFGNGKLLRSNFPSKEIDFTDKFYELHQYTIYNDYSSFEEYLSREAYFEPVYLNTLENKYNETYFNHKCILFIELTLSDTPVTKFEITEMSFTEANQINITLDTSGFITTSPGFFNLIIELNKPINISKINLDFTVLDQ